MTTALATLFRIGLSRGREIISVEQEAQHVGSYLQIQKLRYGGKLSYTVELSPDILQLYTVKLILQPLVENAIKHNQVTIQNPLHIKIYTRGDWLFVENNYQPRVESSEESMGVGFERIRAIYEFYSHEKFVCSCQNGCYVCQLPLLRNR